VIAVAAAGLVVAGYLTVTKVIGGSAAFCTAGGGCDAVQSSRYAMLLGVPTALWGALAYAAVGGLAVAGLTVARWQAAFALAAAMVGFSGYLTWVAVFDVRALCVYCLTSAVLSVGLVSALVWRRPTARAAVLRRGRLVAIGAAAGLAAIVVAAFIHAANPESADAEYREALARHLTARGARMYGGFT
jgi:uncharacterized membrane protein